MFINSVSMANLLMRAVSWTLPVTFLIEYFVCVELKNDLKLNAARRNKVFRSNG